MNELSTSSVPTKSAIPRLTKEFRTIMKNPIDGVHCAIDPSNILNWYFVLDGPDIELGSHGNLKHGRFFGRLVFPPTYPFRPPEVFMDTPSYLFSVSEHVCLTNTSQHPETWTPSWSPGSLLISLRMFFLVRLNNQTQMISADERDTTFKLINHFVTCSKFTTFRINNFQTFFPQLAAQWKTEIKADAAQYLSSNPLLLTQSPQPTAVQQHAASNTTTTSLSGFDHFTPQEQIYLKQILADLPIYAREPSLWFLEQKWLIFFAIVVLFGALWLFDHKSVFGRR